MMESDPPTPTSSTQTTTQAAGTFAGGSNLELWLDKAGIKIRNTLPQPLQELCNNLLEFKLHRSIPNLASGNLRNQSNITDSLQEWANKPENRDEITDEIDETEVAKFWQLLSFSMARIKRAKTKADTENTEATQRRGVDDILELAFAARPSCHLVVRLEAQFHLCRTGVISKGPGSDAIADSLITTPNVSTERTQELLLALVSANKAVNVANAANVANVSNAVDVSSGGGFSWERTPKNLSLILFAGEFKREEKEQTKNQLFMSLATAQKQRRALGFSDTSIFGATSEDGNAVVYTSWWNGTGLNIARVTKFDLAIPIEFLKCYSFFCRLNSVHLIPLLAELDRFVAQDVANSVINNPWRAPDAPQAPPQGKKRKSGV